MSKSVRLLLVQFGDYSAALRARENGEPETYRAQYYSLDAVDRFVDDGTCLVVCLDAPEQEQQIGAYRVVGGRFMPTGSGLRYHLQARASLRRIVALGQEYDPTHVVIRTPGWVLGGVGGWALQHGSAVLPVLADYYSPSTWRNRIRRMGEMAVLSHSQVTLVTNHNYPASQTLVAAGVPAAKVVPWDWPAVQTPYGNAEKGIGHGVKSIRLLYAGMLLHSKGVGDLIDAIGIGAGSRRAQPAIRLDICGNGPDRESLERLARSNNVEHAITFHGQVSNQQVVTLMQQAHAVVVPSRPEYPEGLPNVIYEALETRTPLICSNHPSFQGRLWDGKGCVVFPAGNVQALATAIAYIQKPQVYAGLSETTSSAWELIQCPVTFGDLLLQWKQWTLDGTPIPCLAHSLQSQEAAGGGM